MAGALVALVSLSVLIGSPAAPKGPRTSRTIVPIEILKTKHVVVETRINGKGPFRLILDTGAPTVILTSAVAGAAGVTASSARREWYDPFHSESDIIGTADTIAVGTLQLKKVPLFIVDHPGLDALSKEVGTIGGILGLPFFGRCRMVLDYRNRELALSRGRFEPPGPRIVLESFFKNLTGERPAEVVRPPALWGLVVAKRAIDPRPGVTLTRVLPDGAASEAGLKVGDRVLTIDGRWTDTVLDCHRAAARILPGRPAEVSIWRDGRPLTVKVTPRRGL